MYKAFEQPAIVKDLNKISNSRDLSPRRKIIRYKDLSIRSAVYPIYNQIEFSIFPKINLFSLSVIWTARKYYVHIADHYSTFTVKRK